MFNSDLDSFLTELTYFYNFETKAPPKIYELAYSLFLYISREKQSKTYCFIRRLSLHKRNVYVFDALSGKHLNSPTGEFSIFSIPDERRLHFDYQYHYIYFCYITFIILYLYSFPG